MTKTDKFAPWSVGISLIAIVLVYLCYSMNSGITITNDGSHFALLDALVETGNPELPQVRQFAFGDSALYQGRYYSDRNPGLALTTYLFYQSLRGIESGMQPLRLDPKFARNYSHQQKRIIPIIMLVSPICAGLLFVFVFTLVRDRGVGNLAALVSSLAVMSGTICLRYSTLFYSHMLAAFLLIASLLCVFRFANGRSYHYLVGGILALSMGVLVEHLLIVVFLPVLLYLLIGGSLKRASIHQLATAMLAGLLPMLVLMAYNWICFDSVFSIAHFHHASDEANYQLATLLRFDQTLVATTRLLFGATEAQVGRQDLLGLFSGSPFLYFTLLGIALLLYRYRKVGSEDLVMFSSIALLTLGGASVFAPYGGWDRDYRYFLAAVPLYAPLLGYALDYLLTPAGNVAVNTIKILAFGVFLVLLWVSVRLQLGHIRHDGQQSYDTVFINLQPAFVNVSLFFGVLVSASVLAVLLVATYRRFKVAPHRTG